MTHRELKALIKESLQEVLAEGKADDPTKEEMVKFLQDQFGRYGEEGFEDSAEVAMYWFASHYHGGQWSNLYSVLSTSPFSPGPISRGPEPENMESDMYQALETEFGGKQHEHGNEYDAANRREVDSMTNEPAHPDEEDMLEMSTTGAVQGYMTPNAFKKKKFNEDEQPEPYDAETDQFAPGPRSRTSEPTRDRKPVPQTVNKAKVKKALDKIGMMKNHEWRPLLDRARKAYQLFPDDGNDPAKLNLVMALQYMDEHPEGQTPPLAESPQNQLPQVKEPGFAYCAGCGKKMPSDSSRKQHLTCPSCLGYKKGELRGGQTVTESPQNYFERLDQALTAVEEYVVKNRIQVDTAEHPSSDVDPHGIREPFFYGGIPYGQTKQADYKLLAYKGQKTRKYMHVVIYRTEQGRYELNVYTL